MTMPTASALHGHNGTASGSTSAAPMPTPVEVGPDHAPLWRVTAAVDPSTTPLELMAVWAVRIDPRKSGNFISFSRSIARRLRAAEQGGDGIGQSSLSGSAPNGSTSAHTTKSAGRNGFTRHAGAGGRDNDDDEDDEDDEEGGVDDEDDDGPDESDEDGDEEDEAMKHLRLFQRIEEGRALHALVCRVQDLPTTKDVVALLKTADLVADGTEPEPFEVKVPSYPAPSRNRLPEWKAYWPVSIKYGKSVHALVQPSLSGTNQLAPCSSAPGVVDRAADARMWNDVATEWAAQNFRKCLKRAWQARQQGELAIGVHVTSSYPEGERVVSGVVEGQVSIEVDACDTRRSERNPIKHAVTNAIRDVAKVRSERDWERLLVLNAKVAHLHRDPHADPEVHRQAMQKAEAAAANMKVSSGAVAAAAAAAQAALLNAAAASSPSNGAGTPSSTASSPANRMSNGQDYLLNNLILFTTHEPCVSCCMALVHSRVRAIFFIEPSPRAGGCCGSGLEESRRCAYSHDGGPYAVQEQAGLNHRFDVWRWVGDNAMLCGDEDGDDVDKSLSVHERVHLDILGLDA